MVRFALKTSINPFRPSISLCQESSTWGSSLLMAIIRRGPRLRSLRSTRTVKLKFCIWKKVNLKQTRARAHPDPETPTQSVRHGTVDRPFQAALWGISAFQKDLWKTNVAVPPTQRLGLPKALWSHA